MISSLPNSPTPKEFDCLNIPDCLDPKKGAESATDLAISQLRKQALKLSEPNSNSLKCSSISSNPSLNCKEENDELQNLQLTHKKLKQIFAGISSVQAQILAFFEYWSNNKGNLANLAGFCYPKHAMDSENLLNHIDYYYKWVDCVIPLFTHITKFLFISNIENKLKEHEYTSPTHLNEISGNPSQQKKIHQFKLKLNLDHKETKEKIFSKLKRLGTKTLPPLIATFEVLSLKTAEKISKCAYEIDKIRSGFLQCNQINDLQKEWLFHLQPRLTFIPKPKASNPNEKNYVDNEIFAKIEFFDNQRFENKELKNKTKLFLFSLLKSKTIEDVQKIFRELKLNIEIPSTIEQFHQHLNHPRFLRELLQYYFQKLGRKIALQEDVKDLKHPHPLTSILKRESEKRSLKIDRCLPYIADQLNECRDHQLSFEQIKAHFALLHIDIQSPSLPKIPQNELEWEECLQSEPFLRALAAQWVDFQETTARLIEQALRQALLSKLTVEREFLAFEKLQHCVQLISSAIQLSLCYKPFKLLGIGSALEILTSELTKLGISSLGLYYVTYPLYPGTKFRIDSLVIPIIKHFFAIKYKPNEYSLESYKLVSQIHMTHLISMFSFIKLILQQGLLWVNIRLIDNCVKGLNHQPFDENQSFLTLIKDYEEYQLNCKMLLQDLENKLEQLKVNDAKLIILTPPQNSFDKPYDAINTLAEAIKEADIDYFPPDVIEFFENHVGFQLTNANKSDLQDHLEKFFSKDHKIFSQSFSSQRFAYMHTPSN